MDAPRSITINGDLGSGKSTVARILAERLGLPTVTMGDVHRRMAAQRGMTSLQFNRQSERDPSIDDHVDRIQREMAASAEPVIVDSRLGWHFFTDAFKAHFIVDPKVAARRVMGRGAGAVERYASEAEARRHLEERSESERQRFLRRYHVDKARLRNYDLVLDTTEISPERAADIVVDALSRQEGGGPALLLHPARLYPTERHPDRPDAYLDLPAHSAPDASEIGVGRSGTRFFVVRGHRHVAAALAGRRPFVRAELVAEDGEELPEGTTAERFFESRTGLEEIRSWRRAYAIDLALPRHLPPGARAPW
ncbi:(d)CMP kinase [Actinomadura sp. K4S16]|nr:cytidylate kinase family protein [Actinomadura sp. K4S16]